MKKFTIAFLIAVLALVGAKAYAHDDDIGGSLNTNVGINLNSGSGRDNDKNDDNGFHLDGRGSVNGEIKPFFRSNDDSKDHDINDDKGGLRSDSQIKTNLGFHFGKEFHSIHERAKIRYDITIDRLQKLDDRLQSRITALKAEGKDVANAQASLDLSKSNLAQGKSFVAQAKVIIDAHTTVTPQTSLSDSEKAQVKDLLEKAKVSIKASFEALKDSLRFVKQISVTSNTSIHQ